MVAVLESNERIHCVHMEGLVRARVRFEKKSSGWIEADLVSF
jgi:hypothetical protein